MGVGVGVGVGAGVGAGVGIGLGDGVGIVGAVLFEPHPASANTTNKTTDRNNSCENPRSVPGINELYATEDGSLPFLEVFCFVPKLKQPKDGEVVVNNPGGEAPSALRGFPVLDSQP